MVSEDDLRKNGANLGVGIQVPRAENTIPVTVNNVDQLHTERTTLDRVLKSPEYIDNNIVKVFVKGDVWTLSVDYLQFEYANGSKLTVPANRIDLGPGPNAYANEFTKVGGIIIPGNDGNPRFDRLNTPRIVEGAELVSEHIQRAKTDRVFYGKLVLGFQIALASLAAGVEGLPEGAFRSGVSSLGREVRLAPPPVDEVVIEGSRRPSNVSSGRSTVALPNAGERATDFGGRSHQDFPRIVGETNPGAGGTYNVAPGLKGPDLANPTGMNAAFAEMKSIWGRQSPMLSQARKWGFDAQVGRYFFYDRKTGLVFEGIIQTDKFGSSGRFRP